jgi:hypothetical protein
MSSQQQISCLIYCLLFLQIHHMKIGLLLTALCMIGYKLLAQLPVQPENFISRSFLMKDGLSNDFVTCLLQDNQGFLWIGTRSGLNKFDGYSFTTYRENPSYFEDRQGNIWLASATGLSQIVPQRKNIIVYQQLGGVDGSTITSLAEDTEGKIWISGYDQSKADFHLFRFDPTSRSFSSHINSTITAQNSLGRGTKCMIADNNRWVWAASKGNA